MGVTCSSEAERVQCSPTGVLLAPILAQSNLLEWSQAVSVICSKHSRLVTVWVLFCLCWYDLPNAVMLSSLAAHGTGSSMFNTRSLSVFNIFNANNQKQWQEHHICIGMELVTAVLGDHGQRPLHDYGIPSIPASSCSWCCHWLVSLSFSMKVAMVDLLFGISSQTDQLDLDCMKSQLSSNRCWLPHCCLCGPDNLISTFLPNFSKFPANVKQLLVFQLWISFQGWAWLLQHCVFNSSFAAVLIATVLKGH